MTAAQKIVGELRLHVVGDAAARLTSIEDAIDLIIDLDTRARAAEAKTYKDETAMDLIQTAARLIKEAGYDNPQQIVARAEAAEAGLTAAIRAAKLALFVIRKQNVMPNSSWQAGFDRDLKTAEDALALAPPHASPAEQEGMQR